MTEQDNKIIITVSGYTGSGKSRISYLLKQLLEGAGFDTDLKLSDGDIEDQLSDNLVAAIAAIQDRNTSITINEVNLARKINYLA